MSLKSFKEKSSDFLNNKLMPIFGRMGAQRHLSAARNGIVATIPFVIIGAMALLLLNFPAGSEKVTSATGVVTTNIILLKTKMSIDLNNFLLYLFRLSLGMMGLMSAIGIGSELGKSYRFSQTTSGLMGLFGFLLLIVPINGNTLNIGGMMDGNGIFIAIVGSLIAVEILHFCQRFKITIKMPEGVPDAVANSFASLFPIVITALTIGGLRYLLGFNVSTFLNDIMLPLKNILVGTLGGAILIALIVTFFWWVGIHGVSMVGSVIRPLWQEAIDANTAWFLGGKEGAIPFIVPEQFFQWFIWIGGSGATLGLIIASWIFARSKQMKALTKVSTVPAIFNINEPVIFGLPIVLNPIMLIPFILGPVGMTIVAYLLQDWFGVTMVLQTAWTLPAPIGAFFSAGADWKAIIISLIMIAMSTGIWIPFVIMYDKKLQKEEKTAEQNEGSETKVKILSEEEVKEKVKEAKGIKAKVEIQGGN